jgi:hypothetical protein
VVRGLEARTYHQSISKPIHYHIGSNGEYIAELSIKSKSESVGTVGKVAVIDVSHLDEFGVASKPERRQNEDDAGVRRKEHCLFLFVSTA